MKNDSLLPIIVGGCHRSGTSLVRRILNAHSRIYCGPEANFFRDFYGDFVHDPIQHGRYSQAARSLLPEDELLDVLGTAFVTLHERAAARAGKARWADKDPVNVMHLDEWEQLLGDRWVFVHVVRSPLDTLASIAQQRFPFTIPEALSERIAFYRRYTRAGLAWGEAHPDRYFRLIYDQLVDEPQTVVAALMNWLAEPFEPAQLVFNSLPQGIGIEDPKVAATVEIHRGSVGSWSSWFTAGEAAWIAEACDPLWRQIDPEGRFGGLTNALAAAVRLPTVLVVSKGDDALLQLDGVRAWHFPLDVDEGYAGYYPADSAEAITHLEDLRTRGADHLLVPHVNLWWLEHYAGFRQYLHEKYPASENSEGIMFNLGTVDGSSDAPSRDTEFLASLHPASAIGGVEKR